ncbi:MAG: TlpA disulfide reductase family protein [Bacteroidales bacterium]|jgi:thiol-disulfide isomerase/thioredoxin
MKTIAKECILLLAIISMLSLSGYSQKIIKNPIYHSATSPCLSVSQIEFRDSCTILHFCITDAPGVSFVISDKSYIKPSFGGDKVIVTRAESARIGEKVFIPSNGNFSYQLYFPPIDQSTPMIDFGDGSENDSWFIYNLEIVPQKHSSIFPEEIEGNWFRTDGSREWVYGFQSPVVLFNSQIIDKVTITKKEVGYLIRTNKNGRNLNIYTRSAPDGNLFIGTDPGKLELFSRTPVVKSDYVIPGDKEFVAPLLKSGKCVFSGYLKGYLPKMGSTGMLYDDNVLTNNQNTIVVKLSENGSFSTEVEVDYPHEAFFSIFELNILIFLEPGKSIFTFIDLTANQPSGQVNLLFMGDLARINSDLAVTKQICGFDFNQSHEKMKQLTLPEFKSWMLDLGKQKRDSLMRFSEHYPLCKKALQTRTIGIYSRVTEQILWYSEVRKAMSRDNPKDVALQQLPDSTFYFFFPANAMNSEVSLISYDFGAMLNRFLFSEVNRPGSLSLYQPLMDSASKLGIEIREEAKPGLRNIWTRGAPKSSEPVTKEDAAACTDFVCKHHDLVNAIMPAITQEKTAELMKMKFRLEPGLITDIGISQGLFSWMRSFSGPLTEYQSSWAKQGIRSPFIRNYVLTASKSREQNLAISQTEIQPKTGISDPGSPATRADSVLQLIIGENKGKLLFIDFWATWCGPCLADIARMKPLKEEYKARDIEFIYITDPSSPEKTYNQKIQEIRGRHYRLSQDDWNYLSAQYNISGIPHYMLIDKNGKLVNNGLGSVIHSNDNLRKVFDGYLK